MMRTAPHDWPRWARSPRRPDQVDVVCQKCGRPLGYLTTWPGHVTWSGATFRSYRGPGGDWLIPEGPRRWGFPCVRKCGAAPVYTEHVLRAKYEAAKAAGQPTVAL